MNSVSVSSARRPTTTLSGEMFGVLINLSGRRRFTSQRLVLFAVLASLGHEGAMATAHETLTMFRDAHAKLVEGDQDLPGIYCEALREVYYGQIKGDQHIRDFISLATRALDAMAAGAPSARVLLDKLVHDATPLLAVLNQITAVYEQESKKHALQLKKERLGMMSDIERIARQARMISFNGQIAAARAGATGAEFSVVAKEISSITIEMDELIHAALAKADT